MRYIFVLVFLYSTIIALADSSLTDYSESDSVIIQQDTITDSEIESQHLQKQIDSLSLISDYRLKSELGRRIAWQLIDKDWNRSVIYLEVAEENAKKTNDTDFLIDTYYEIGNLYYEKDLLDISLSFYIKADNLITEKESPEKLKLENAIAVVHARLNNKEEALKHFKQVYLNRKKDGDSIGLAKVCNNLGLLYLNHNIDSAITYFNESLNMASQMDDQELNVYLYTNLGRCYSKKKEEAKARNYFNEALNNIDAVDNKTKAWVYSTVAKGLYEQSLNDSAIYYATKALNITNIDDYSIAYRNITQILYKAYLRKGNYQKASAYFVKYDQINDSLNFEEKAVHAERLKQEQNYFLKEQKRKIEERKTITRSIIIALSFLLVLLILFILLIKYKNKLRESLLEKKLIEAKKDELNLDLESKSRTLIAKAMKEIHRTEFIQEILEDLKKIKLKAVKKETQSAINYIQTRLEKDTNNQIWEEFELSFEQVHEQFFTNLQKQHPDLTSKDRRLCALLVLNMSSKEIAQITGQDFKSVENSRTRLRKKLNLTNTKIDLTVYLNSLK